MRDKPAQKKRFIAGVTCPSCRALDKIYVTEEGGEACQVCNSCGYKEYLKGKNQEWKPIKFPGSDESSR